MRPTSLVGIFISALFLTACGGGNNTQGPQQRIAGIIEGSSPAKASTLVLTHPRGNYTLEKSPTGYLIKDSLTGASITAPASVNRIQFADVSVALDIDVAGKIYRLYKAAFDRQPDLAGLGFWLGVAAQGYTLEQIAFSFMESPEFLLLLGANPSDQEFITKLYKNVLNRAPDSEGLAYWINALKTGTTRAQVLVSFSESAENVAQVAASIEGGIAYAQTGVAYQPVAKATGVVQGQVGTPITLNGNDSSDANGDSLSYTWSLSKPAGSYANAISYNQSALIFTPDVAGTYTATLIVSDGKLNSAPDTIHTVVAGKPVISVADTGTYKCSTITHAYAVQLYNQGHTYLDRDHDGKPCEATDISVEVATATPPTTPNAGMCYVRGYYRKNGTYVSGYWRRC